MSIVGLSGVQPIGCVLALGTLFSLACCAPAAPIPAVSPQADAVDVRLSQPPAGARALGNLEAVHGRGCGSVGEIGTEEGALAILKTEAAKRGANYVYVAGRFPPHPETMCFDQSYRITGIAYIVPDGYPPDDAASQGNVTPAPAR